MPGEGTKRRTQQVNPSVNGDRFKDAVSRAQQYLLDDQYEEGYWWANLPTNPTMEAEYIMLTQFLGSGEERRWEKAANHIEGKQKEDGSWSNYRGGPGDLSTTVECYFALKLAGRSVEDEVMSAARNFILEEGGLPQTRVFTKIWLSLFGIWDWDKVPEMPPELIYLPRWFPIDIYELASWARGTVVPLLIVISERPVREVPEEKRIGELFPPDWERNFSMNGRGAPLFSWPRFFSLTDNLLRSYAKLPWKPFRERAKRACARWIVERQEADGSWGGIQPPWFYSLIALDVLGYSQEEDPMKSGLEGLEDYGVENEEEWWFQASASPGWDTPWSMLALVESGLSPEHEALRRAGEWLLGQEIRSLGDWAVNVGGVEPSGWAFEFENENYPDTDDTAEILLALDKVKLNPKGERRKSAAIDRGFSWLMALQSSNGGWGAYDVDNDMELLYEIPFADFGAMIDPPSVDVTAHVLEMMGHFGFTVEDDRVKEILNYIREEQKEDGSWFGRWGINYIYGIGSVLPALEAVGENMEAPYVRRAADWLVKRQNDDGGWGETAASYEDPSLAGQGPSTASQTAWALLALLAARGDCPPVKRGVDYLLRNQNDQGTWEEKTYTGTGFPRDFYLRYELYSHYFPLLALGRYSSKIEEPL